MNEKGVGFGAFCRAKKRSLLWFFLPLVVSDVWGYSFTPTEVEWMRWPYYCQAMYAHLDVAYRNGYWKRIPKAEADKWFKIGDNAGGAWHYCAGLTHIDRAEADLNPVSRERTFHEGIGAVMFSYDRTEPTSPWYATYTVTIARGYRGLKDYANAIRFLNEGMKSHPEHIASYSMLALVYMDQGLFNEAKSVLLKGDEVAQGKSSELAYYLGFVSLELGDIDNARVYLNIAESLGYPLLEGLKKKIEDAERSSVKKKQ